MKYSVFLYNFVDSILNNEMKIVYIHDNLAQVGGVERILADKMNYLSDVYGYDVFIITSSQGNKPFAFPLSSKVKHIDLAINIHHQYHYKYPKRLWIKYHKNKLLKNRLTEVINQINPDILICPTNFRADIVCQLKCNAYKIIESHCAKSYTGLNDGIKRNLIFDILHKLYMLYFTYIVKSKSNAIITLTHGDKKEWSLSKKTFVIPNIVNKVPKEISCCCNKLVISVGRLTYQKGFERLITAWEMVNKKYPDWLLTIYGSGEDEETLRSQIKQAKLENIIHINPPTPEIYSKMQESSIFVFPSRYEGFGLVLIEAMINGVPCISFDCPYGPSDIINNGNDGFLIPNGNIQAMADKICYLIKNEEIRIKMGKKAHQSAMRYSPGNIMPLWDKLFNEIVNQ